MPASLRHGNDNEPVELELIGLGAFVPWRLSSHTRRLPTLFDLMAIFKGQNAFLDSTTRSAPVALRMKRLR